MHGKCQAALSYVCHDTVHTTSHGKLELIVPLPLSPAHNDRRHTRNATCVTVCSEKIPSTMRSASLGGIAG